MDRIETLKLEDRKLSTVPYPVLGMIPVGVATDSVQQVEYSLIDVDSIGSDNNMDGGRADTNFTSCIHVDGGTAEWQL